MALNDKAPLTGTVQVPGDKSISHRAIMFGAMAEGTTTVEGFLPGDDCLSTISCFRQLGVSVEQNGTDVTVTSPGMHGWTEPADILDTGNSGTTTRLMLGILAGTDFHSVLNGDASIAKRPMGRVIDPLRQMGADIRGRSGGTMTPLAVTGSSLQAIDYDMPVASAQVKSAILLAAIWAEGTTAIREKLPSRNHTEILLPQFGVPVDQQDGVIRLTGGLKMTPAHVSVPGDISSAAFFIAAALMVPDSEIRLTNVGVNPTRTGILEAVRQMGGEIETEDATEGAELAATLTVRASKLKSTEISGALIPRLIDELPIIALLATQAEGTTVIRDAEELRVKETDRIQSVVTGLKKLGADAEATSDGMIIKGPVRLRGAQVDSFGDHRLGMTWAVASLIADGDVDIINKECISVSYPTFFEHLHTLQNRLSE
ncbi:3-phosphoshikimate 1-carboxyvinyltransferase [Planococcus lenghuensis]|uniref:3-phosphoshikimate 1-carboxyvinyltransferase n=1 Tax=Planococcus lenghuensis TaxID=2213202 RepID=A0A1Q2L155_9BACL|nr:3-phosphoshikimate 1-carboxyvinyltransferase [Planococcus lenghuensis]AQQ53622.1 3-phosphoshikimate 1-carboxyvinyltransferase [Planococcus lenghuensis]